MNKSFLVAAAADPDADYVSKRISKFWSNIDRTDKCWFWLPRPNSMGYGTFLLRKATFMAHRIAYELVKGPIPRGMFLCHTCDVPRCVNPEHMFLGSQKDNMQDSERKGRTNLPGAKLTLEQVRQIALVTNRSRGQASTVARMFNVSPMTVSRIWTGLSWKTLTAREAIEAAVKNFREERK